MPDIVTKFEEVRQIKLVGTWFSGNFKKNILGIYNMLSVLISKFCHSINSEKRAWPINVMQHA